MPTTATAPKKLKKVVPLLFYAQDIENAEYLMERYGLSQAAITRTLYRKEVERLKAGATQFDFSEHEKLGQNKTRRK